MEKTQITATVKGSYLLLLSLSRESDIAVGALGYITFRPGIYFYCGSAMGGIGQRVGRHFRTEKKLRWHIDFLLQRAEVFGALLFPGTQVTECHLLTWLSRSGSLELPVKGFGSSDCNCPSHLLYLADEWELAFILTDLEQQLSSWS